jgi:hypothetical protein
MFLDGLQLILQFIPQGCQQSHHTPLGWPPEQSSQFIVNGQETLHSTGFTNMHRPFQA